MKRGKFLTAAACVFLVFLIVVIAANSSVFAASKSSKAEKGKALRKEKQDQPSANGKSESATAYSGVTPQNFGKPTILNFGATPYPQPSAVFQTPPTGLIIQTAETPVVQGEVVQSIVEETLSPRYYSNELLIKVKKEARGNVKEGNPADIGISSLNNINREFNARSFEKVAVVGANSKKDSDVFSWYKVTFDNPTEIIHAQPESADGLFIASSKVTSSPAAERLQQIIQRFSQDSNIEAVEPNYIVTAFVAPNDPYYSSSGSWGQSYADLWGIKKINPEPAWDQTTGSNSIVVADVDTGVDRNHEDISANMWTNPNEIPNNNIDDDNNGYKDDYYGWDWVNKDNDPMDDYGHGTHTVGTIAAVGNNAIGVVGVNWQAKIMALKFLDASGSGYLSDGIKALQYAADMGAKVSSNSWGCGCNTKSMDDAIKYEHEKGMVIAAAAGNSNGDALDFSPASADRAITVAASDSNDAKASFSNFGEKIDVAAPGVDILSIRATINPMCTSARTVGTKYCRVSGTSMATPHVAGLAALIWAKNPSLTNEEVRQIIRTGSNDLGPAGKDKDFGYGRINAANSINLAGGTKPLSPIITSPDSRATLSGVVTVKGSIPGPNFASYKIEEGLGRTPSTWNTIAASTNQVINGVLATFKTSDLKNGLHTLRLTATDTSGKNYQYQVFDVVIHENFPEYLFYVGGDWVTLVNTKNNTLTKIEVPCCYKILGIDLTPDEKYAYVSDTMSKSVYVIDTSTNTIIKTIPIDWWSGRNSAGTSSIPEVAVTPDGKYVYVPKTNFWTDKYSYNISVIDAASQTYLYDIVVGAGPSGVAVTPDSKRVYVANYNSNTTSVIDTSTNTVIATIQLPSGYSSPHDAKASPDGKRVYVAAGVGVVVIDTSTNTVAKTLHAPPNPFVLQPTNLAISPDGRYVYVADLFKTSPFVATEVYEIDTTTDTVKRDRNLSTSMVDMEITPDGKQLYIAHLLDNGFTAFNISIFEENDLFYMDQQTLYAIAMKKSSSAPPSSNNPPVSSFTANPTSGNAPLTVNFDGSGSSDPDQGDSIISYSWTFGDGATGSGVTTSHIYQNAGTYTSTLVVTDTHGATGTSSKTITVTSAPAGDTTPPTVKITSPPNGTIVTSRVTVTADATDNVAVNRVEFYDGSVLKANDTSAPYSFVWNVKPKNIAKGSHLIKAVAFDTSNNKAEDSIILCKEYCTTGIVSSSEEEGGPTGITGALVSFFDGIVNLFTRR